MGGGAGGGTVESIKDGSQRRAQPPFLPFTSNPPRPFIAAVSSRDNVEQISKVSMCIQSASLMQKIKQKEMHYFIWMNSLAYTGAHVENKCILTHKMECFLNPLDLSHASIW